MKQCEAVAIGLIFGAALLLLASGPDTASDAEARPGYAEHHRRHDHGNDPELNQNALLATQAANGTVPVAALRAGAVRTVICKPAQHRVAAKTRPKWRPTMIFIAGLEGCGHHGVSGKIASCQITGRPESSRGMLSH